MRIGIDATCWANERGYGRYTRELVGALVALAPRHQFVCLLDDRSAERFTLAAANVEPVVVRQRVAPTLAAATGDSRSPADMLRLTAAVRRARLDVFYSPSVYGFFPLPPGLPAVVTVHDAIAERFPALTLPSFKDRLFWRLKVALALRQSTLVLTVSPYAARQLKTYLGIKPSAMRVTLEAVSSEYFPVESRDEIARVAARVGLAPGSRWFMYVGGFGPHKQVDQIVRAHARVAALHGQNPPALVLAGPNTDGFHQDVAAIQRAVRECGTEQLVHWAGFLSDMDLRHLHSGALALLLVSSSEGFGLPAIEAARCGAPVVATTESPLPEVLEGGGMFVTPGDLEALTRALDVMATDEELRSTMGREALRRASELSWSRSAQVALDALEEAAAARRRRATALQPRPI